MANSARSLLGQQPVRQQVTHTQIVQHDDHPQFGRSFS